MRTEKKCRYISIKQSTVRKTMEEVYQEYCTNGRGDRAILQSENRTAYGRTISVPDLENGI